MKMTCDHCSGSYYEKDKIDGICSNSKCLVNICKQCRHVCNDCGENFCFRYHIGKCECGEWLCLFGCQKKPKHAKHLLMRD